MAKKTMMLALAIGALLAIPPAAQAAELIEGENPLKIGSEITLTSTNTEITTATGTIYCELIVEHAKVLENGPNIQLGALPSEAKSCGLTAPPVPVKVTEVELGFFVLGGGTGGAATTFKFDIPPTGGLVDCHLQGFVVYTYEPGSNVISIGGSELIPGIKVPAGCPKQGIIHGDYSLETANGVAVHIE